MTRSRLASWVASGVLALTVAACAADHGWCCSKYGEGRVELPRQGCGCSHDDVDGWRRLLVRCCVVLPQPPGADQSTGHVCIKGPVTVTIDATSGRVDLASLVLAEGATVRVSAGAGLFVWKDDEADFSLVRADSAIHVSGGTLGGPGKLLVRGLVTLAPEGGQPATLGTSDGPDIPRSGGRLVLDDQGHLRVEGSIPDLPASRLTTAYRVKARGTVTITDEGSLSADHGTSFALVDQRRQSEAGTLVIENEQGYDEGDDRQRPPAEHVQQPGHRSRRPAPAPAASPPTTRRRAGPRRRWRAARSCCPRARRPTLWSLPEPATARASATWCLRSAGLGTSIDDTAGLADDPVQRGRRRDRGRGAEARCRG